MDWKSYIVSILQTLFRILCIYYSPPFTHSTTPHTISYFTILYSYPNVLAILKNTSVLYIYKHICTHAFTIRMISFFFIFNFLFYIEKLLNFLFHLLSHNADCISKFFFQTTPCAFFQYFPVCIYSKKF